MPQRSTTVEEPASSSTKRTSSRQRRRPTIWTREKIYKLIELYRGSDCLWNHYSELYKNKDCRTKAIDHICNTLGITKNDYGKKVHNLRNQFNSELKKYERRLKDSEGIQTLSAKGCRWEHFETLMFLRPIIEPRPGYQPQCKKTGTNDEIANTEPKTTTELVALGRDVVQMELLSVGDACSSSAKDETTFDVQVTPKSEAAANPSANPLFNNTRKDSPIPNPADKQSYTNPPVAIQPSGVRDQWDAFGELIANEFRNLNSALSRKKLKRKIMQVMLEIGEEDDQQYTSHN